MACIFCQIAEGKKPAKIYYEDEQVFVFADILPRAAIHLLICPVKHYINLQELPDQMILRLMETARKIARELALEDNFTLVMHNGPQSGQIIEHLHFHFMSNCPHVNVQYRKRG